jgi:uncharacterized protein YcbK (DUF882 family)
MHHGNVTKTPVKLSDLFRYYKHGTPHQMAAIVELEAALLKIAPDALNRDQPWFKTWSQAGKQESPRKAKPNDAFSTRLSENFTLGEFALGQPARRFVAQHQVDTAVELAAFLERVRTAFGGKRITITSGYRPAAINRAVGGASGSEHLYDAPNVGAVDFYVDGVDINKVQAWVDREWPYSLGYGAPKGFVHLGIRKGRPRVRWDY